MIVGFRLNLSTLIPFYVFFLFLFHLYIICLWIIIESDKLQRLWSQLILTEQFFPSLSVIIVLARIWFPSILASLSKFNYKVATQAEETFRFIPCLCLIFFFNFLCLTSSLPALFGIQIVFHDFIFSNNNY